MPHKNHPVGNFLIREGKPPPVLVSSPGGRGKGYGYQSEIGVYNHQSVPKR